MSERSMRNARKAAKEASEATAASAFPAVRAALQNEQTTRARVDALETAVKGLGALAGRSLKGRLTWLLKGK